MGLVVLVGVEDADGPDDVEWLASKLAALRLFPEGESAWARSVAEIGGEVLLVSQFTSREHEKGQEAIVASGCKT